MEPICRSRNFELYSKAKSKGTKWRLSRCAMMSGLVMLLCVQAFSQRTLTGKVFDAANNKPLASANVATNESKNVVLTDRDGNFNIPISSTDKVVFISYIGYQSQSIRVKDNQNNLEIGLQPSTNDLETVTVIGTRNLSRTNVQSPVPVDIIPVSRMSKQVGQIDVNQLLTYSAPSFHSSRQTVSDGTDHMDPAQLRGLGSDQVLVLVNGKRYHQAALVNVNGTVNRGQVGTDLNTIPVSSIERIEVLRDGAAAQYGSDAIAGVINIVLKNNTNVLSGNVSYGENITSYPKNYALDLLNHHNTSKVNVRDGGAFDASLNYGVDLNKKGFLNFTGEYSIRDASNRAGTYTGQLYPNLSGANKDDSILQARGLTRNNFDMRIGNAKIVNGAIVVNGAYSISKQWQLQLYGDLSQKNGEAAGIFRYPSAINSAAGTYAQMALQLYPDGFLPLIKTNIKDYSFSIALNGKLGEWNTNLSNTTGANIFDFAVDHSVNYTQFAVSSNPQTKFDAGGLKFLQNTSNIDLSRKFNVLRGLNVAYGAEFRMDQYSQQAGEEASYKNYNTNSGASPGAQVFAGFIPAYAQKHSRNNAGVYLDLEEDFTKRLLLQAALRFENYSDFGSTLDYKIATRYKIADVFSVRGSVSTGFRAPSLQQKFYAKTNTLFVSTTSGLVPTESGTFTNDSRPAQILGIFKLKEETSQNYSVGFTANPARGLDVSVDAYMIKIKNRIILTNNFNGGNDTTLTRLLKESGATTANFFTNAIDTRAKGLEAVVSYHAAFANENKLRISVSATFMKNEIIKDANGKPAIKASQILVNSGQIGNYFNREDQSRFEVANPSTKGNLTIDYDHKKFFTMLRLSYFGKVTYLDPTTNPANPASFPVNAFTGQKETLDQVFSAKTVTDLSAGYGFTKYLTVTVGANNLFDVYQDKHTHSGNISLGRFIYSRRIEQMGYNGRFVFARLSFALNNK
jgi:iron complex outermembrane recepter protein